MPPFNPPDLDGKSGDDIADALFGIASGDPSSSWTLTRKDARLLEYHDKRLGLGWPVTAGYLIALQEVSSQSDAKAFATSNKVHLLQEGGLYFRSVAELPIMCSRPPPSPTIAGFTASTKGLQTTRGVEIIVGYPSFLFTRLVAKPAQEADPELPDPDATTTLVLRNVERAEVHHVAELALFLLRRYGGGTRFAFCHFGRGQALVDDDQTATLALPAEPLGETVLPEALAFFNRADEAEPISGFLYYYRVLEACFESVLDDLIRAWRRDAALSESGLLKQVRALKDQEDKTGLRLVLGAIVDQALLDSAAAKGLLTAASVELLVSDVYQRRNAVAHGRRGQHQEVLVPFAFSPGRDVQDAAWSALMRTLALRAIDKFILTP